MEPPETLDTLTALAHDVRLKVYRLLAAAGDGGLRAGEIAKQLDILPGSLSAHLSILARAGVATQERRGNAIIYRARPDKVRALAKLLVED